MATNTPTPDWLARLYERYASGIAQVFLLTGNTRDYAGPGRDLVPVFLDLALARFDVVGFYNRASGLWFSQPKYESKFMQRAGLAAAAGQPPAPAARPPREPMAFFPAADRALKFIEKRRRTATEGTDGEADAAPTEETQAGEEPAGEIETVKRPMAMIIEYPETLFPATTAPNPEERNSLIFVQRWALDQELTAAGGLVILVGQASSDIHATLRAASSRIEHIEVPMPDYETRLRYVQLLDMPLRDIRAEEVAAKTAGLSLLHIEDLKLKTGDEPLTREMIRERKDEIIRSELADVVGSDDPTWGLDDVGGLEEAKTALLNNVVRPLQTGNLKRVPLGVLLSGPAGTGKTYLVKAVAHDAGVNYLELDFGRLQDSYVGQSERNLERILSTIEAAAPCLVFVDELDQALRRGTSGLNPVQDHLFGRFLRFMSVPWHRGRIVVIAATNRPDLIDAALKRAGRFGDLKIPILPPDAGGRADALRKLVRRNGSDPQAIEQALQQVARQTDGWTPAELEALVLKAVEVADDHGRECLDGQDVLAAAESLRPPTDNTSWMTDLALAECSDLALLPAQYRERAGDRAALEEAVARGSASGRGRRDAPELAAV